MTHKSRFRRVVGGKPRLLWVERQGQVKKKKRKQQCRLLISRRLAVKKKEKSVVRRRHEISGGGGSSVDWKEITKWNKVKDIRREEAQRIDEEESSREGTSIWNKGHAFHRNIRRTKWAEMQVWAQRWEFVGNLVDGFQFSLYKIQEGPPTSVTGKGGGQEVEERRCKEKEPKGTQRRITRRHQKPRRMYRHSLPTVRHFSLPILKGQAQTGA